MNKLLIIKKDNLLLWLLCALIGASAIATNLGSVLRYTKYLIPFVFLTIAFFGIRKLKIYTVPLQNLALFSGLIILNLVVSFFRFDISLRFFEEAVLIILPIISIITITTIIKKPVSVIIDSLFYVYAAVFVVSNINFFFNPNIINEFILALKTSNLKTESWMAFPFGLFLIFYILEKRKGKILFALVLFLLAFKRISILGVVVGFGVYWFFSLRGQQALKRKNIYYWFIFLNISLLFILYHFIEGSFNSAITNITGISPNYFTQGRLRVYSETIAQFPDNMLLGNSLGSTNVFLSEKFENINFLHSDILKIIIEMGLLSYFIWVFMFFKINLVSKKAIPILLFINILFLSDNVFIYFDTLFIFYLIITHYRAQEDSYDI